MNHLLFGIATLALVGFGAYGLAVYRRRVFVARFTARLLWS